MTAFPCYCPHCGALFTNNAISFGGGTIVFQGTRTNCPVCGKEAKFLEGAYSVTNDVLTLLRAPPFTIEVLNKFAAILTRAKAENQTFETVKAEAEKIDPRLGDAVEKLRGQPHAVLMFIFVFLLAALRSCHFDIKADTKIDINQIIYQIMHQGEMHDPVAPLGKPNDPQKEHEGRSPDSSRKAPENEDPNPPREI